MHRLLAVLILVLASCTPTTTEMRDAAPRNDVAIFTPPREAAACIGRAIESVYPAYSTQWREAERPGDYEVRSFSSYGLVALVDVAPSAVGSAVTIYIPHYVDAWLRTTMIRAIHLKC